MGKLVLLKIGEGSLALGFPVTLQMGAEGYQPTIEVVGAFPPALELWECYRRWQVSYYRLSNAYRLEAKTGYVTNVSVIDDCSELATIFRDRFHQWFQSAPFQPVREKLLTQLTPSDTVRVIIQTAVPELRRFPWHLLPLLDTYPNAEVALSNPWFEPVEQQPMPGDAIRVLAILGNASGLNIERDRTLLSTLPHADIRFLVEPSYSELNDTLWDDQGWDILFFAGHSFSQRRSSRSPEIQSDLGENEETGKGEMGAIAINPTETISMTQLKYALKTARQRGLNIAIFNSCDGLGLAQELAELNIPQILVMREPIPDPVAHSFLKTFLWAFAHGKSLYLAVREARERLQGLENQFPCASWLPTLCQNPAQTPPTWQTLYTQRCQHLPDPIVPSPNAPIATQKAEGFGGVGEWGSGGVGEQGSGGVGEQGSGGGSNQKSKSKIQNLAIASLLTSLTTAAILIAVRFLGGLQALELMAYDSLLRLRPQEIRDSRIVVIETGPEHVEKSVTLSNEVLNQLLIVLEAYQPRVIGLDLYRDFSARPDHEELAQRLQTTDNLLAICRSSDESIDIPGISPSPDMPETNIGFSDLLLDSDGVLRRQLVVMTPEAASPCQAPYAFSTQLAFQYLAIEGYTDNSWTTDGQLQLGDTVLESLQPRAGPYQMIDVAGYQLLLNYRHLLFQKDIAHRVTLENVLTQRLNPEALKDKIVLIGRTDLDSGDLKRTPYSHQNRLESLMPGVMIHAQMVSQLLSVVLDDRSLLQTLPEWQELCWILLWALVAGGVSFIHQVTAHSHGLTKLILALVATETGLWLMCCILLIEQSLWVPLVPPAIAIVLILLVNRSIQQWERSDVWLFRREEG